MPRNVYRNASGAARKVRFGREVLRFVNSRNKTFYFYAANRRQLCLGIALLHRSRSFGLEAEIHRPTQLRVDGFGIVENARSDSTPNRNCLRPTVAWLSLTTKRVRKRWMSRSMLETSTLIKESGNRLRLHRRPLQAVERVSKKTRVAA